MSIRISNNLRFALWRQGIPRTQWITWVAARCELGSTLVRAVIDGRTPDDQVGEAECSQLARAIGMPSEAETLRFADLVSSDCDVLRENLAYLMNALGHGGKKALAATLSVDPTTISRWLNGTSQPNEATLRQLAAYFGVSAGTDLRSYPVFLSLEPVALTERRQWLISSLENLSPDEFRDLYPALRRMLGPQ
jgi:transcriptional regulator with XRE-family HTH domain